MRVCPNCGHRDPPYWRPAKMHNPSGDMDICRDNDLEMWQPEIFKELMANRGTVVTDSHFAYLIGKRGVWVRRVTIDVYKSCGIAIFKPPFEGSGHNPLGNKVSGRTRTTFHKANSI